MRRHLASLRLDPAAAVPSRSAALCQAAGTTRPGSQGSSWAALLGSCTASPSTSSSRTFLYAIGFVGHVAVPKDFDGVQPCRWPRRGVNSAARLFAVQPALMARLASSALDTRVPESSNAAPACSRPPRAVLLLWRAALAPAVIWSCERPVGAIVRRPSSGWLGDAAISTFLSNHSTFSCCARFARLLGRHRRRRSGHRCFRTCATRSTSLHLAFWATPSMIAATCCSRSPPRHILSGSGSGARPIARSAIVIASIGTVVMLRRGRARGGRDRPGSEFAMSDW